MDKKKNIGAKTNLKKKKNTNSILDKVTILVSIILVVVSLIFFVSIVKLNLLKNLVLVVIAIIIGLFDFLLIKNLLNKKRTNKKRFISIISSLVLTIVYLLINVYISSTVNFVKNVTKVKSEYQTYSVVVKSDSNISNIKELKNKKIGFVTTNMYYARSEHTLSKIIKFKAVEYDDTASVIDKLNNSKVSAITFENNYLSLLEENNNDLYKSLKVIYTYKVKVPKKNSEIKKNITEPFIIYISGSDSRGTLNDTARSDVNMIAVINPKENKILLVNIPRDYYVQLHGTTGEKDKLTHAGIYGVNMSKDTIADLFDVNIDYFVKVGFSTVIKSVDLVGGIDIYSDKDLTCHTNKSCVFHEGTQHVNGECALAFSRERYAYTTGDRHRGENQQQVITKLVEKFSSPSVLTKYNSILNSLNGSFQTNLSYNDITSLIKDEATSFSKWNVESISVDGTGASMPTYSMGSQKLYVMIPDENTVNNAKNKIKEYMNN